MEAEPLDSRTYFSITLLPLALFTICYLFVNSSLLTLCPPEGDAAVTALDIIRAKRLELLTGPYTRFGFRHPGPLLAYYYAAADYFLFFITSADVRPMMAQFLLNVCLCAALLRLICKHTGSTFFAAATLALILWFSRTEATDVLHSLWGPSAIAIPMTLFVFVSAVVMQGHAGQAWLQVLCASIVAQTHLSGAVIVLPILILSWAICVLHHSNTRKALAAAGLMGVGLWIPPILDVVWNGSTSNFSDAAAFLGEEAQTHTVFEALTYVGTFYVRAFRLPEIPVLAVILPLLFLGLLNWISAKQRGVSRALSLIFCLEILLSLLSATRINGQMYSYLMWFHYPFIALTVALFLAELASRYVPPHAQRTASLLLGVLAPLALIPGYSFPAPACSNEIATFTAAINPQHDTLYEFRIPARKRYAPAAGVFLHFVREGYSVCVPEKWRFMFGAEQVCSKASAKGRPSAQLRTIVSFEKPAPGATGTLIGDTLLTISPAPLSQ